MRCDFKEGLWTIIELTIEEISLTDRKLWSSVRAQENLSSVNDTSSSPAKYFVRLSIPLTKALKEKWRKPLCENTVMWLKNNSCLNYSIPNCTILDFRCHRKPTYIIGWPVSLCCYIKDVMTWSGQPSYVKQDPLETQ